MFLMHLFQANCYAEESYSLSSLHCAEVSVDLKRARSLVRVNEIQSTLQEQRYLINAVFWHFTLQQILFTYWKTSETIFAVCTCSF